MLTEHFNRMMLPFHFYKKWEEKHTHFLQILPLPEIYKPLRVPNRLFVFRLPVSLTMRCLYPRS